MMGLMSVGTNAPKAVSDIACLVLGGNSCPLTYRRGNSEYFSISGWRVNILKKCKLRLYMYGYHSGDGTSINFNVSGSIVWSHGPSGSGSNSYSITREFAPGEYVALGISGASYYSSYGYIQMLAVQ